MAVAAGGCQRAVVLVCTCQKVDWSTVAWQGSASARAGSWRAGWVTLAAGPSCCAYPNVWPDAEPRGLSGARFRMAARCRAGSPIRRAAGERSDPVGVATSARRCLGLLGASRCGGMRAENRPPVAEADKPVEGCVRGRFCDGRDDPKGPELAPPSLMQCPSSGKRVSIWGRARVRVRENMTATDIY